MREWLRETHGPGFELLRHFLLRFFDSDVVCALEHNGFHGFHNGSPVPVTIPLACLGNAGATLEAREQQQVRQVDHGIREIFPASRKNPRKACDRRR